MKQTITVEGMNCEGCEESVEDALESLPDVERAEADRVSGAVEVEGDAETNDLRRTVEEAGYTASS